MTGSVNFNPFTGKVFTAEEINKLDTDKSGTISYEELQAGSSWLSGGEDAEGDVQIGDDKPVTLTGSAEKTYGLAVKNGVKDTASDSAQLKEYMNTIIDTYIEQYIQQNPGMEAKEKSSLITFIKSQGEAFVNEYTQKNTAVPYNTKSAAGELMTKLDSAVADRKATADEVNMQLDDYKNNVDANYEKLSQTTDKADDDYVTGAEFKQMKEEAVAYIMGMLLNGNEDSEFLSSLNSDYKNNSGYKVAMAAVKAIEGESDPAKIKEYLEQAKTAIEKLIGTQNADGSSKLNNSVNTKTAKEEEAKKAEQKAEYKETLSSVVDDLVESYSNTRIRRGFTKRKPSEAQVEAYQQNLTNIMNAFIEQYQGDGKNLKSEFNTYMNKVLNEQSQAKSDMSDNTMIDSADKYAELKNLVNGAGTYASEDEKAQILDKSVEFIINQLGKGISDISLLSDISSDYATNEKFIEAKKLIDGFKTSVTPKEDIEKAKQLLKEMMTEIGADKIIDGVKNKKMPAVTLSDDNREALTSSIAGYENNESISTGRYKDRDDALDDIQNQAKAKLEELRSKLLAQLKEQMGADYDEAKLNAIIDDAIYQTINDFTDMRVDRNGKHYTTDSAGFVTSKSGRKSRGVVNIKQLVDAFLTKFQELSTAAAAEIDKTKNPVTTEDVMLDTPLADDYQDKKVKYLGDVARAKQEAKNQINIISLQLKSKLRAQLGSDYDSTEIDKMIRQATLNTLDTIQEIKKWAFRFTPVNTRTIADKFMEEFNKLYEESRKEKTTEETTN